jgi:hypothetical protein
MKLSITETEHDKVISFTSEDEKFPVEIIITQINYEGRNCIEFSVTHGAEGTIHAGCVNLNGTYFKQEPLQNGKLTGVQLRAIAAKDQLDALLEDDCYDAIKCLAEANPDLLQFCLEIACDKECVEHSAEARPEHNEIPGEHILKAIKAMALFCYTEIVERGLKKPGLEE